MERLALKTCPEASEMIKEFNEQVSEFRNRSLLNTVYPVLWVDALYEKVCVNRKIISMTVLIVYEVGENGYRGILAVKPMAK